MSNNLLPAHFAVDPKCRCCGSVVEYNSPDYRFGLCTTCSQAVDSFIQNRRKNLQRKRLVK